MPDMLIPKLVQAHLDLAYVEAVITQGVEAQGLERSQNALTTHFMNTPGVIRVTGLSN